MITADALVAHAVGDYILQSDWQAQEKTKRTTACLVHVILYTVPFALLTKSVPALVFIAVTHFIIDRWRLARYVVWAKNFLAPKWIDRSVVHLGDPEPGLETREVIKIRNPPWYECRMTGYPNERPQWMTVWLMIVADNIMHVILNGIALKYF